MLSKKINYIPIFDVTILQMKQADDVVQSSEESKLSTCVPQKKNIEWTSILVVIATYGKIFHWIQVKKENYTVSGCLYVFTKYKATYEILISGHKNQRQHIFLTKP